MNSKFIPVIFVLGGALGSYLTLKFRKPEQVINEVVKDRIVTVTKREKRPDGSTSTTTTTTKDSETTIPQVIEAKKPNYSLGLFYNLSGVYGVQAERRIMGDLWAGVAIDQKQAVFLNIRYEF